MERKTADRRMDRRSQHTRKLLVDALCELVWEKPPIKITVREIAQRANVSRGTFYLHFTDIPDMYQKLEDQVFEAMLQYFRVYMETLDDKEYERFILEVISYIGREKKVFQLLFTVPTFNDRLAELLKGFYLESWNKYCKRDLTSMKWEFLISYHVQGILTCVRKWLIEDGFCKEEDLTRMIILLDNQFDKIIEENFL